MAVVCDIAVVLDVDLYQPRVIDEPCKTVCRTVLVGVGRRMLTG
jgi:hypothetical protein